VESSRRWWPWTSPVANTCRRRLGRSRLSYKSRLVGRSARLGAAAEFDRSAADESASEVARPHVFTASVEHRAPTSREVVAPGASPLRSPPGGSCRTSTAPSPPGSTGRELIDVEGVERAGTVAIDGLANVGDKVSQLRLVVLRDHGARCLSLRLAGHKYEATQSQPRSGNTGWVARTAGEAWQGPDGHRAVWADGRSAAGRWRGLVYRSVARSWRGSYIPSSPPPGS
jgi:hypothetical protein